MRASSFLKKLFLLFIVLSLMGLNNYAQAPRETRAVWLTTNFRLDWPPARYDEEIQKNSLIEIFDDIKKKNFNTVYFQVRFNGTVLFNSSFEPLSFYITGKLGDPDAYDPLRFAIELAHKRGIELHAWVNMIKVLDGTEKGLFESPKHICQIHPDWVIKDVRDGATAYWLDPGLPAVKDYLTALVSELALNYDIDGLQYDYLRYPGRNFDDEFSYGVHGGGMNKDEWRRNNLTEIVKNIAETVKEQKPNLKIGAAPIGIYRSLPNARGLEGVNDVYQDSRTWLKLKYLDYVVPQIYWSFDGNPKFDIVAADWNNNSFGRNVILGIGAYKPEVYLSIDKMIEFSRSINADGVAFFRYKNIRAHDFPLFANKAFPSAMPWLDGARPNPPSGLNYAFLEGKPGFVKLTWTLPERVDSDDTLQYYSLYSIPSPDSKPVNSDLFEIIGADRNNVTLGIKRPKKINYFFTLKSITKLWNESSASSNVITVTYPELSELASFDEPYRNPMIIREKNSSPKILLYMPAGDSVTVMVEEKGNIRTIAEKEVTAGKNLFSLNADISNADALVIKLNSAGKETRIDL